MTVLPFSAILFMLVALSCFSSNVFVSFKLFLELTSLITNTTFLVFARRFSFLFVLYFDLG